MLRDVVVGYEDYCQSIDGGYFTRVKPVGGCLNAVENTISQSTSPAKSGAIHLRVSGIFLDQRYKVSTPSGVSLLPTGIGGIKITKEGLGLNPLYDRFNDPSGDVDDTDGIAISMNPILFSARKDGSAQLTQRRKDQSSSADTDFSNHGTAFTGGAADLPSYLFSNNLIASESGTMSTDSNVLLSKGEAYGCGASGNCYAQYEFSHLFEFKFGDLPNMRQKYLGGCEIACLDGLNIQMFSEGGVYQVDSRVSVSKADLPEDTSYIDVTYPNMVASDLFRQPGEVQFSDIFTAGDLNAANVRSSSYNDLDDQLNFNALFTYGIDSTGATAGLMALGAKCDPLRNTVLLLRDLAKPSDIAARLNTMMSDPSCKIDLPVNYYGTVQTINYHPAGVSGTPGPSQASADITEIDGRTIKLSTDGSELLSLDSRTTILGSRVATTIALQLTKTYTSTATVPAGLENTGTALNARAVVYRVHGDNAALSGFLNGGGECAGNNLFWTSDASRDDYRVYAEVWSGSETYKRPTTSRGYTEEDADKGRPYGTCTGAVDLPNVADSSTACTGAGSPGSCLGGTWTEGQLVRYRTCKEHSGTWKIVSLPAASVSTVNSADDTCTGDGCGSGDNTEQCLFGGCAYLGYSDKCGQPADQEQTLIRAEVDNVGVPHVLTTTDRCTGTLKFQVEDTTRRNEFAVYKVQTACSRMSTSNIDDSVDLAYEYTGAFNLENNQFSVTAKPSSPVLDNGADAHQVICDANDLSASPPVVCRTKQTCVNTGPTDCSGNVAKSAYDVVPFFGTCVASDNSIDQSGLQNATACEELMGIVPSNSDRGWSIDGAKTQFEKDSGTDDGMEALKKCANSVTTNTNNYIVTYEVGMQYTRYLVHDPSIGINYCDSQTFTTTINRDATASVTTSNIVAAALNRAVYVQDIGWLSDNGCGADNYRLHVLMVALDQDSRTPTVAFAASDLTAAFVDSAAGSDNPNNMEIYAHSSDGKTIHASGASAIDAVGEAADGTFAANGDRFQVRSQCVAISGSCDATDADGTVDGDSWADFSQAAFTTDLVIRGTFQSKDIDTRVAVSVNFDECPLEDAASVTGQTFIGLHSACDNALNDDDFASQSVGQPLTDGYRSSATTSVGSIAALKYDCTSANADDVLRVDADVFAVAESCTVAKTLHSGGGFDVSCKLDKAKHDEALEQGWSITSVDMFLDRSILVNDNLVPQTAIQICGCASGTCAVDAGFNAAVTAANLDPFLRASASSSGNSFERGYLACGRHGVSSENTWGTTQADYEQGSDVAKMQLPLMPLSAYPGDVFSIRYEAVLTSSKLRRRRMLRAVVPIKLRSSALAEGSTHAISVIQVASESYNEDSPAGSSSAAPAAPAAADAPAVPVSDAVSASSTTESSSSGLSTGAIIALVAAGVAVIVGLLAAFNVCGIRDILCCRKGDASADEERTAFVGGNVRREEHFTNLRY